MLQQKNTKRQEALEIINKFQDKYFPKTLLERFENTKEDFMKRFTSGYQNFNIDRYNLEQGTNIPHMKSEFNMRVEPELERMRDEEGFYKGTGNVAEDGWVATESGQQWIAARLKKQKDPQEAIDRFFGILKNDFANPVEAIPDSALEELKKVLPFVNADSLGINILPYTAEEEEEELIPPDLFEFEDEWEKDIHIYDMIRRDKDKGKVRLGENISF